VSDDDLLPETLAGAVADGAPIDWADVANKTADTELMQQLRVIAAIGAARQTAAVDAAPRWTPVVYGVYGAVLILAAIKLALALLGVRAAVAAPLGGLYLLNMLLFGVAGVVLIAGGARDRRLQLLGGLFVTIATAFVEPLTAPVDAGALGRALAAFRGLQTEAFLSAALWLFVWSFPTAPKRPRDRRLATAFIAAAFAIGVLLFGANALRGLAWPADLPLAGWLAALDRNAPTLVYWPLLFLSAAPAIPFLLLKSRQETPANQRKVTWFVAALGVGLMPMVVAVIASPFVPALQDPGVRQRVGIALYAALASVVPTTAYAVAVDRVMNLHFVVRTTLKYALARHAMWALTLGPLSYLAFDLYQHRELTIVEYVTRVRPIGVLALSVIGIGALALRQQMLHAVDRWFQREPAELSQALARVEQGFRVAESLRDIARVLSEALGETLHAKTVAVLLANRDGSAFASLEGSVPALPADSALLELVRATRSEVQIDFGADGSVARLLPETDRDWLAQAGVQLLSPLIGSSGTLLGVVAIGEPGHGLGYARSHYALVTAVSGQAAMQIENRWLRDVPHDGGRAGAAATRGVDWRNEPATYCPACGLTWTPETRVCACGAATRPAALPLFVNEKFRVERLIGAGGTGVVYLAVDMTLGRKVAIKTLPSMRRENAVRLHWEARAMATVMHPNLALIYGAEDWRGAPLLIVEYLEGGTLLESLRRGRATIGRTIDLGIVLADVLDRMHTAHVLHRDIKPSNIGYTADGLPKLLDFGLAGMLDRAKGAHSTPVALPKNPDEIRSLLSATDPASTLTVTQQVVGTPLYLSPEALGGAAPDASFDLWSLSMVLYECVAGRHPFAGGSVGDVITAVRQHKIPDVRDYRPDCPALLAAFLTDALSPVVARRPPTADDLRTHLRFLQVRLDPPDR
jgi:hypothetical protein